MFFAKKNKREDIKKMRITVDNANFAIENGKLIIDINATDIETLIRNGKVPIGTLKPKDIFKIDGKEFIVLDKNENGVVIISKEFTHSMKFGENTDWKQSAIRKKLNGEYLNEIAKSVGENNIKLMKRDLLSMDGLDDYGECEDKISLLTMDEYRKYHKILGVNKKYNDWWWTITPASTPQNGYSRGVCCVDSCGVLFWNGCVCCRGVRPFLTLDSSVLVSLN